MAPKSLLSFGVCADGSPVVPPVTYDELAQMAKSEQEGPRQEDDTSRARALIDLLVSWLKAEHLGEIKDLERSTLIHADDPAVGWGVIYHKDVPPAIRNEVERLRVHRKGRLLNEWRPFHSLTTWLGEQGITILNRDTDDLPFYILIVANPKQITFQFQHELGRIRAVGRLELGDDPAAYSAYVDSVLEQEKQPSVAKRVLFAAARNPTDEGATVLSADLLVPPLVALPTNDEALQKYHYAVAHLDGFTRGELMAAIKPDTNGHSPAFVFVAAHGLQPDGTAKERFNRQGSWISSEWKMGAVPADACLTGAQVGPAFHAPGSIFFALSCFGAGTPQRSDYARWHNEAFPHAKPLAPLLAQTDFVANLPKCLLSYRSTDKAAGALAYVGHVDLSWPISFWDAETEQVDLALFKDLVRSVLRGDTVGMAVRKFSQIVDDYNDLLATFVTNTGKMDLTDAPKVGTYWIGRNNARGFIVLGDPAVRIVPEALP